MDQSPQPRSYVGCGKLGPPNDARRRARELTSWSKATRLDSYSGSMTLPHPSRWVVPSCAAGAALVVGALIATAPLLAAGAAFGLLFVLLAFAAPVVHLTLLLFVAAIVPYSVQNSLGGGSGLVLADVLLLTGLARAVLVLLQHPLDRRQALTVFVTAAFVLTAVLNFVYALNLGHVRSEAGFDLRNVMGVAAVLIALPILSDSAARLRLFKGMVLVGLLLGLWGIAQWLVDIPFGEAGDVGVREGVAFTTGGRGQIQGGAFAFPLAIVLSFAALISRDVSSWRERAPLLAVLLLNSVSLMLTFERAFWIGTAMGLLVVMARAGSSQRVRVMLWTPVAVLLLLAVFATVAPGQITAAGERLLSVREYESDISVAYRVVESQKVVGEIRERPFLGSGVGASIWWGLPAAGIAPQRYTYTHNGYLWLVWKLGVIPTFLMALLFALALLRREGARAHGRSEMVMKGAQAGLFVLLILAVTSPVFSTSTTPVTGLLLALSVMPRTIDRTGFSQQDGCLADLAGSSRPA